MHSTDSLTEQSRAEHGNANQQSTVEQRQTETTTKHHQEGGHDTNSYCTEYCTEYITASSNIKY